MTTYTIFGEHYHASFKLPLKGNFKASDYCPIDLSEAQVGAAVPGSSGRDPLEERVAAVLRESRAAVAWGGYGERRALYQRSGHFAAEGTYRNVHLGIDFWAPAGTEVQAPLPGVVHSLANNSAVGDYGPTVILEHLMGNGRIYSLYGHLSTDVLHRLSPGQLIQKGEVFAALGAWHENVHWPPHLHFQLIREIGDARGDYPGVCAEAEAKWYLSNCPNPLDFFAPKWRVKLLGD